MKRVQRVNKNEQVNVSMNKSGDLHLSFYRYVSVIFHA